MFYLFFGSGFVMVALHLRLRLLAQPSVVKKKRPRAPKNCKSSYVFLVPVSTRKIVSFVEKNWQQKAIGAVLRHLLSERVRVSVQYLP